MKTVISEASFQRLWRLVSGAHFDGVDSMVAADRDGQATAIELESGLFLYALVRRLRPRVVVETGTHKGFSGAWIACALKDNHEMNVSIPAGHLHTVDANRYDGLPEYLWTELEVDRYITHYIGDSDKIPLPVSVVINFLWLDADHSAESINAEWDHLGGHLDDPCWVAFHDTFLDARMNKGIEIIKKKAQNSGKMVEHLALRNMRGFDLLQLHSKPHHKRPDAE